MRANCDHKNNWLSLFLLKRQQVICFISIFVAYNSRNEKFHLHNESVSQARTRFV